MSTDARLSAVTAEFIDPAIEQGFRRRDEKIIARQAGVALLIGAVLNLAFGYTDYIAFGLVPQLWLALGARSIIMLACIAGAVMMLRRPSLATSGIVTSVLEIALISCFTMVVMLRPAGMHWHVMIMLVITFSIYMFVPNRFVLMAVNGVAGSAIYIPTAILTSAPNTLDTWRMILILSTANMVGMISAYRFSKLRRREYLLTEELKRMATTDDLTGLVNRRHYLELSSHEIKRAQRLNTPLTVCVLDVDHFKQINDTFGHAAGDAALRAIATACRETLRDADIFSRFGGEEFTITFPGTNMRAAREVADRLCALIRELHIDIEGLQLSATFGLAQFSNEGNIEQLLSRADLALYEGKRSGRNRVVEAAGPSS